MRNGAKPGVLVTAVGAPPGLNALRALYESGRYGVVAADADLVSAALYRYGVPHAVLPRASDAEYLPRLFEVARRHAVSVVLPCIEDEIIVLANHGPALAAAGVRALLPGSRQVLLATDKGKLIALATAAGFACPVSRRVPRASASEQRLAVLSHLERASGPPWIIKPVRGHGMRGVHRAESVAEAMTVLETADDDVIVQEFVPGPVGSMYLVGLLYDRAGRVIRRFSSRSIRTLYPTGGPATAGVTCYMAELIAETERLIREIGGWRGPVNVEWMLDPRDKTFKLIEVNPRLWGYGYLAVGAGVNFPVATVEAALDHDPGPDPGFRDGVTLLRMSEDFIFPGCPFDLES